jgi:hypothetical protein
MYLRQECPDGVVAGKILIKKLMSQQNPSVFLGGVMRISIQWRSRMFDVHKASTFA